MPKMIVSIDEVVIKEVQLTKDRTTLGRRPYNDIVIDNLAVSGEHAVLLMTGGEVFLEDLNSTNGTYVNGKAVKKTAAANTATALRLASTKSSLSVTVLPQKILTKRWWYGHDLRCQPQTAPASGYPTSAGESTGLGAFHAAIKVLSGAASGREVPLTKVVTTIGKPGVAVAAITRRQHGYVVHHVEGAGNPTLNGVAYWFDRLSR